MIRKLFREPLLYFLLIGCMLFGLRVWIARTIEPETQRIVVNASQIEALAANFSRTWMRPPTEQELANLVEGHVRDEVYYREAMALGLDRNDPIIRRHLRQKMEMLLNDTAGLRVPSDVALTAFMEKNRDKFQIEPSVSFIQVFVNPEKRQDPERDAGEILRQLQAGTSPEELGDATLAGYRFEDLTPREVENLFGNVFTEKIFSIEPDNWTGPLASGLGLHLVYVTEQTDGRLPELSEIRSEVEQEWLAMRSMERKDETYRRLREGYEVIIDEGGVPE